MKYYDAFGDEINKRPLSLLQLQEICEAFDKIACALQARQADLEQRLASLEAADKERWIQTLSAAVDVLGERCIGLPLRVNELEERLKKTDSMVSCHGGYIDQLMGLDD